MKLNWNVLQEIYELAGKAQVNFSMNYQECDHYWYFTIDSTVPQECWVGKAHSFNLAVESVIEFLDSILS